MTDSKLHWESIYKTKPSSEVSWYRPHLDRSLEIILGLGLSNIPDQVPMGGWGTG